MPELPLWRWVLAAFCAFNIGVAKTGVPGLGILAVPLFVIAVGDARLSAGWLLPLLLMADLFAVGYYRKHNAAQALFTLAPGVLGGMALGALVLRYPERILRPVVGGIILGILVLFLLRRRGVELAPASKRWTAGIFGTAAGFATMVANAAGPVMNVYLLSRQVPREEFVATGAWFFFVINLIKLPVYTVQGLIRPSSLLFDLALAPWVVAGACAGRKVLAVIPESVFVASVTVLSFLAALLLFWPR